MPTDIEQAQAAAELTATLEETANYLEREAATFEAAQSMETLIALVLAQNTVLTGAFRELSKKVRQEIEG